LHLIEYFTNAYYIYVFIGDIEPWIFECKYETILPWCDLYVFNEKQIRKKMNFKKERVLEGKYDFVKSVTLWKRLWKGFKKKRKIYTWFSFLASVWSRVLHEI
jgi:hypothetical protein